MLLDHPVYMQSNNLAGLMCVLAFSWLAIVSAARTRSLTSLMFTSSISLILPDDMTATVIPGYIRSSAKTFTYILSIRCAVPNT